MGLFGKKEKKSESAIPSLPNLPKLPDFPNMDENIRQLPSFPSNSIGKKFSQDSIKDAVSGERGGSGFYADDSSDEEERMTQEPLGMPLTKELDEGSEEPIITHEPTINREPTKKGVVKEKNVFRQEAEPVFVRIDKFEDALKIFDSIKSQISDIERMLAETKKLKEKEDTELQSWEDELKKMREEIERIGTNIFSKV